MSGFPSHHPRQIEFIQQTDKSGCGIACVAMLAGMMYKEAKGVCRELGVILRRGGLIPDEILEVLGSLSYCIHEMRRLPTRGVALVAVDWTDQAGGHLVVWDARRRQFLDPRCGVIDLAEMMAFASIGGIWAVRKSKRKRSGKV